jgi:DNA-binding transcriptional MerR regulator
MGAMPAVSKLAPSIAGPAKTTSLAASGRPRPVEPRFEFDRVRRAGADTGETYSISSLAREFGCTTRAIRFYEDEGLLSPARQGLNRIYRRRDRARLMLILRGKRLGFSISDIREMLDLYDLGDGQIEQMKLTLKKGRERLGSLERHAEDIALAITELREGCKILERMLRERGETLP